MFGPYVSRDSVGNTSACIQFNTMFPKTVFLFAVILMVAVTAGPIKESPVERKHFKNYLVLNSSNFISNFTLFELILIIHFVTST